MISLPIVTKQTQEVVDITERLQIAVQQNVLTDGLLVLFLPHTTAALTTAELKPGMDQELLAAFARLVPQLTPGLDQTQQQQILAALIDPTLTIPIQHGQLMLGTEQRVVLIELEGPQERQVSLSFIQSAV